MGWMKVDAARRYAGGVGRKTLYKAVACGHLRVARIGAGRSILFCEKWIDEWLETASQEAGREGGLRLVERKAA